MTYKVTKLTDIDRIEEVIERASVCRLGLVDDDEPYIIPVCFAYERGALYFHGNIKGRKVELIKKNNRVCFEVDIDVQLEKSEDPCDWVMKGKSVVGIGRATILEDDQEKLYALRLIMRHYSEGDFDFLESALASVLVVRIDISSITGKEIV
jgi:nitroimidazol reductase NimA-like FMN-containing flavoprotein (pyridoxamine 5'-phosphate oxidase superfamily)